MAIIIYHLLDKLDPPAEHAIQGGIRSALDDSPCIVVSKIVDFNSSAELEGFCSLLPPAGAIISSTNSDCVELVGMLAASGCPYVAIAPDAQGGPGRQICSNDRQGMVDATNYLIALGHRRIGFVSSSTESYPGRERELGFIDALAEHGLDFGAQLVVPADDGADAGREAGLLLMSVSPRPTAIIASTDAQAAGVLQAARLRGIAVPAALSVMGFGDGELAAALAPALTTMHVPYAEMGFTAAIKLLDPARADMQPTEFFCELVVRESTAPPP